MSIELSKPTRGTLHEHISSPPALPICFDGSEGVTHPKWSRSNDSNNVVTALDFVLEINTLGWGACGEIYPVPRREEIATEWNNVEHNIPAILAKWRDYGLFGTNIEGWFTLDPRNGDSLLRAIALFGFVLWFEGNDVQVLCGFHRSLGINVFNTTQTGRGFKAFQNSNAEVYVVIPTLYVETDHPSTQYLKYDTLETS
jgi:hypothetical protein